MAVGNELCLLAFFLTLSGVYGGEFCYDHDGSFSMRWCSYGCCGYMDRDCCDANVALIVGLTILAILVVSGVITLVCCCMRRRGAQGQVINNAPPSGTSAVVVSSGTNHTAVTTMGQPMAYSTPYSMQYHTQTYQPGTYVPPAYPMGPQPPPPMGYAAAMGPPPYSQVAGQDNQAFKTPN